MKPVSPVPASLIVQGTRESFLKGGIKDLKSACKEFESLFIEQMLKQMRRSMIKSGFLDGGIQEDIYQELFDQQVARELSRGKGIGLADRLLKGLRK